MSKGIEEIRDVVEFGLKLGDAFGKALADGKIDFMDALKFLPALRSLKDAVEGADKIPAELKDLDEAEKDELLAFFKDKFDLDNDELEFKIEAALGVVMGLVRLILGFIKK